MSSSSSSSSLIGQLPLAAVWLYCKDVKQTGRFYKDIMGLKPIEDENGNSGFHFDLRTIRLSLLPHNGNGIQEKGAAAATPKPASSQELVFVVENSIEAVFRDLVKRGVKMKSKKISEDGNGKTVSFTDPDGHVIYLWQPPEKDSRNFKAVEHLVKHYESVSRAVADLREYDEETEAE
jgi:catechol 2,3-dioxygenase-like lactoylglutathione lyase family enzyme